MGNATPTLHKDRVQRLKQQVRENYSESMAAKRKSVFDHVWRSNPEAAPVKKAALGLAAFLQEKEIVVSADDLIAGGQQFYDFDTPEISNIRGDGTPAEPLPARFRQGYRIGLFCGALGGHVIAGYHRVLKTGFGSLIQTAARRLETCASEERDFCEASLIVCRAASLYARRYADRARRMAEDTEDLENRDYLSRIASSCEWIAIEAPRTFHEALQLLWITHEIITCEQRSGSLSLGRLDQVLFPYYEKDLADNRLSRHDAQELIDALWIKFAGLKRGFQNITLGGSDGNGSDLTNELSFFFLRATRKLRMDQPLLSVRHHAGTPDDFWAEVEGLVQEGMGFPALFNEELVIEAKKRVGVAPADAANWGIVGCVEPSVPGKEFSHTEGLRVNWAKILELMLNKGICTVTGEHFPLLEQRELSNIRTFDEFYRWYRDELKAAVDLGIEGMNVLDAAFSETSPYPFLSSTMEGCIEAGRDVTAGSTVYNFCTVNALGMANVADSLAAIKHVAYSQKLFSLSEIAEAVALDFDGKEPLRQAVSHCAKYGNDQDAPDGLIAELCDYFHSSVTSHRNGRGGNMQCGLYSPVQGSDTTGPTAVTNSCTKIDHRKAGNGMVLDMKFSPSFFRQIKDQGIFRSLVETYFDNGGMEIQFNVIDRKTLLEAKDNPEEHQDLVVRVSGFSAYFVDLPKVVQEEIIARTEYVAV